MAVRRYTPIPAQHPQSQLNLLACSLHQEGIAKAQAARQAKLDQLMRKVTVFPTPPPKPK